MMIIVVLIGLGFGRPLLYVVGAVIGVPVILFMLLIAIDRAVTAAALVLFHHMRRRHMDRLARADRRRASL
jgi:hypothetical protein